MGAAGLGGVYAVRATELGRHTLTGRPFALSLLVFFFLSMAFFRSVLKIEEEAVPPDVWCVVCGV